METRTNWPQWLKEARTENAQIEITDTGAVIWRDGEWHGGVWRGGVWHGGVWRGGVWRGGEWRGGEWRGGVWRGGEWRGGEWRGGEWHGGEWHDASTDRILFMAAAIGIVFDEQGFATAYRTTQKDGKGRYTKTFTQTSGRVDVEHSPAGAGTCVPGLHATSAALAWTYFGINPDARLWRVRFRREDLLDCDGQKLRLRGAWCEEIPVPWKKP